VALLQVATACAMPWFEQVLPHIPQLLASDCRLTQLPQFVLPDAQQRPTEPFFEQFPLWH
jgi:hypothetical protein